MDLVFEHVKADRGIILLLDPEGRTAAQGRAHPRGRRRPTSSPADENADGKPAAKPEPAKIHASRTIINHVLHTGEGVLSSNAMTDQRFSKGKSVHNLGIRSALCVPIKARKLTRKGRDEVIWASSISTARCRITPIRPISFGC